MRRYATVANVTTATYTVITVASMVFLCLNWSWGGRFSDVANGGLLGYAAIPGGLSTTIAFLILPFARSGLRHYLLAIGIVCIWLSVYSATGIFAELAHGRF